MVRPSHRPPRRSRPSQRLERAFALIEVLIAGIMVAIGLTAIITVGTRALALQQRGEREVVAASLLDEVLSRVLADGPDDFVRLQPGTGVFDRPFDDYEFEVVIADGGLGIPARVLARVFHPSTGGVWECETLIAIRTGDDPHPVRVPFEPIDREDRYRQLEEQENNG